VSVPIHAHFVSVERPSSYWAASRRSTPRCFTRAGSFPAETETQTGRPEPLVAPEQRRSPGAHDVRIRRVLPASARMRAVFADRLLWHE
jgi:hypothetical protein